MKFDVWKRTQSSFSVVSAAASSSFCFCIWSSENSKSRTMNLAKKGNQYKECPEYVQHVLVFPTSLYKLVVHSPESNNREQGVLVVRRDESVQYSFRRRPKYGRHETHVDDRGTTKPVNRSYFRFQSLTIFLTVGVSYTTSATADDLLWHGN